LVDVGYESAYGLKALQLKLALKDAFEAVDRQWLTLAAELRQLVMQKRKEWHFTEEQAHYAFFLSQVVSVNGEVDGWGGSDTTALRDESSDKRLAASYLRHVIRRERGERPSVRQARGFPLEAEM
jgi:hypothetical protein